MKRFLLAAVALLGVTMGAKASDNVTWDFDDEAFSSYYINADGAYTLTEALTINGLTLSKDVMIRYVADLGYYIRLAKNNEASLNATYMSFEVDGPCTIGATIRANGTSQRAVYISTVADGTITTIDTETLVGPSKEEQVNGLAQTYSYTGEAATIAITVCDGGVDFSEVSVTYASSAIESLATSAEVISVEYINLAGIVSKSAHKGLNIVKTTMADGTVKTTKLLK